jgi:putative DNA methylase
MLSTKVGKEAYIEPVIESGGYRFTIKVGEPSDPESAKSGTKLSRGANFRCVMSGTPIAPDYIYAAANSRQMGARLMAIVAEGDRSRVYLPPTPEAEAIAHKAKPEWQPELAMPENPRWFSPPLYGLKTYGDIFTPRQLVALTTFSDLVQETRERVRCDALSAGLPDDTPLATGGTGASAYGDAVTLYLACALDRVVERHTSIAIWDSSPTKLQLANTFRRQAIPMTWDFAEGNPFCMSSGTWSPSVEWVARSIAFVPATPIGVSVQADASSQDMSRDRVVATDPPYYDNIGYADLSDFFYVWLRRALQPLFHDLFATLAVPKSEELVATPYRHGSKEKAEEFFLTGMTQAMHRLAEQAHAAFPVTIFYAFKQAEIDTHDGTASTGWETFLEAVIRAGFAVSGTWPVRTELTFALKKNIAALASSIVLVCRKRAANPATATRREFITALKNELPAALAHLQHGNIAPVDLAQAAIGPGMAVYTRYSMVIDAEGNELSVRQALTMINEILDEVLAEQEGDFDSDTRWALAWFEQFGFTEGEYGFAETLSKAKNTSVSGMVEAGILASKAGKVRLLSPAELPANWDPAADSRLTVWEMVHHLIRTLAEGESAAAALVLKLGTRAEVARELAYRLFALCERKKRANEALAYNGLVLSWPEILRIARQTPVAAQTGLFEEN